MREREPVTAADDVWLYLLHDAPLAGQEGLIEQAWQYVTEFSPDYLAE